MTMANQHIAVDGHRLVAEPRTSGATYLAGLLNHWTSRADGLRISLLLHDDPSPENPYLDLIGRDMVQVIKPSTLIDPAARFRNQLIWNQVFIPRLLRQARPDVYFSPFHLTPRVPSGIRVVTTVHDLCFLQDPSLALGALVHRAQLWTACGRSDSLICISRHTHQMLSKWDPRTVSKTTVIHNGADDDILDAQLAQDLLAEFAPSLIDSRYFIWIGNPTPRKSPGLLLDSFALFSRRYSAAMLVLIAPAGPAADALRQMAEERGLGQAVLIVSGVSAELRSALYRCAVALVFPSRCEGFGYPVLEAMLQGCPAICLADGPAKELLPEEVPLVPLSNPTSISELMVHFYDMNAARREVLEKTLAQHASKFSSRVMADATLAVLLNHL